MLYVDKFDHCFEVSIKDLSIRNSVFDEITKKVMTNKNGSIRQEAEPKTDMRFDKIKKNLMVFFHDYNSTDKYKDFSEQDINQILHSKYSITLSDVPDEIKNGDYLFEFKSIHKQSLMTEVWDRLAIDLPYLQGASNLVKTTIQKIIYRSYKERNKSFNEDINCPTMSEFLMRFYTEYNQPQKILNGFKITQKEDVVILSKLYLMSRFAEEIKIQ